MQNDECEGNEIVKLDEEESLTAMTSLIGGSTLKTDFKHENRVVVPH